MDTMVERCAGVDIGKAEMKVCVREPGAGRRRRSEVRTFSTMSAGILDCRQWLAERGVTLVGMEATGDYWKPVYYLLEDQFEVWLLNARHLRHVPGRKTDVNDATWIAQLVEHGLVRPSFVPPPPIRRLRDLTRYRSSLVGERSREILRLEKVLEDAGIKVTVVTSKTLSKSSRDMLEALIAGQRDPKVLAEFARGPMRAKRPALREALVGQFSEHHALLCRAMLDRIDQLDATMATISARIDAEIAPFRTQLEHLITIPGISDRIAEIIIAEIGVDMTRFPTAAHLVSWAGVCPGNNESAGKHHSGRTRKGDSWLRGALGEAAIASAITQHTYLAARYRRLARRRGKKRALVAVANTILTAVWHMLSNNTDYTDLGPDHHTRRINRTRQAQRLTRQLTQLGYRVTLEDAA
jgi:transposase